MAYADYVSQTERRIINRILRKALKLGYTVSVFDGEEWALARSTDIDRITSEIAATDCTTLRFRNSKGDSVGQIFLVHGNEEDVVSDMSDNAAMAFLTGHPVLTD